jgi:hypothetical protein
LQDCRIAERQKKAEKGGKGPEKAERQIESEE